MFGDMPKKEVAALKAMSSVWVQISPQIHHETKNAKPVAESRGRPGSSISRVSWI